MYVGWTDERVETLTKLWIEGLTASQIARIIGGMSRNAVIGKAHRIGLAGRVSRDRRRDHLGGMVKPTKDLSKVTKLMRKPAPKSSPVRQLLEILPTEPVSPVEELHIPIKERKSIATLEANDCRWPIGNPGDADFHFCGKRKVDGISYCEHHARRAYAPPAVAKTHHHDRPSWSENNTGRKNTVFMSGREKMKAY